MMRHLSSMKFLNFFTHPNDTDALSPYNIVDATNATYPPKKLGNNAEQKHENKYSSNVQWKYMKATMPFGNV